MSDRTRAFLDDLRLSALRARYGIGRAIARAFPNEEREIASGSLRPHEVEDVAATVLRDEMRSDTLRDPDTGAPLHLPLDVSLGAVVPRSKTRGQRQQFIEAVKLQDVETARKRAATAKGQAALRASLRSVGCDYTPPKNLSPSEWKTQQGIIGTEFLDDVPAVEPSDEYVPFKGRGLGLDHGRFQATARSTPVIWDSIVQQKNFLVGARWEWGIPDFVRELVDASRWKGPEAESAKEVLRALGIDVEILKRAAEELNVEFAANPNLDLHQTRSEMCLQGYQAGFAVHEFGIDPNAELARRIAFIELRNASSVDGWITGPYQELLAIAQEPPSSLIGGGRHDARATLPVIDARKVMHFAVDREGANFEGVSRVRPAMFWRRLGAEFAKASILHVQRFGRGIPVIRRPKEAKQDKTAIGATRAAAKNYYNSQHSFFDAPEGFDIEILQMQAQEGGLVQVLEYCDKQARTSFGTGVFDLGRDGTGSYALATVTSQLVMQSLRGFSRGPERAHRSIAKAYVDAVFGPQPVYPELRITGILSRSPQEAISAWQGVINIERSADLSIEERNQLRADAGLPSVSEDDDPADADQAQEEAAPDSGDGLDDSVDPADSGDDTQDTAADPAEEDDNGAEQRAAHTGNCRCRKCKGGKLATASMRAKKVEVLCRGGSYVTHRELSGPEVSVNFRALDGLIDDSALDGLSAIEDAAIETRRRFIELADPLIEAGDIAGIALLEVDTTAEVEDALRRFYGSIADRVMDDMLEELRDLAGDDYEPEAQETQGPGPVAAIAAMSTLVAANIVRQFNARLRSAAISVAQGGRRTVLTRALPSETFAGGEIRGGTLTIMGETREYTALTYGPKIRTVIYSAVMDANTCEECKSEDLNEFRVGTASWERVRPPNRRCEGELSGRAACRCIGIYVPEQSASDTTTRGQRLHKAARPWSVARPWKDAPKAAPRERTPRLFARGSARRARGTDGSMNTTEHS